MAVPSIVSKLVLAAVPTLVNQALPKLTAALEAWYQGEKHVLKKWIQDSIPGEAFDDAAWLIVEQLLDGVWGALKAELLDKAQLEKFLKDALA